MRTRTTAVAALLPLFVALQVGAQPMPPPAMGEMEPPPGMDGMASAEKVTFSPDGTMLSTVVAGAVRTWQIASGEPVEALSGLTDVGLAIAWSPDGSTLAVGGVDGTVSLFSAQGEPLHTLEGHTDFVRDLAFSPAGSILASCSDDGTIRLWDAGSGELIRVLEGHPDYVRSIAFGPRGQMLASGCDDGIVRLWDVAEGSMMRELEGHVDYVRGVDISPDGTLVASGSDDTTARLWNAVTGETVAVLEAHTDWVRDVVFSPDGKTLASGGDDATVYLWDVQSHDIVGTLQASNWILSVAWNPDGSRIATGDVNGLVSLWDPTDGALLASAGGTAPMLLNMALSPNGNMLAACSGTDELRLWDLTSDEELPRTVTVPDAGIATLTFDPSGRRIAVGGYGADVAVVDAASGEVLRTLEAPQGVIALQVDGRGRLWGASMNAALTAWDMDEGTVIRQVGGGGHSVTVLDTTSGAVVSADRRPKSIAAAVFSDDGGRAFVGDEAEGTLCLALSPDGRLLATGSTDGTVQLGEAKDRGGALLEGEPHYDYVRDVAFSPNGRLLASASDDGTVKVWSVGKKRLLRTLEGHTDWVRAVVFIDNERLVSCADDGTARIWNARTGEELRLLQTVAGDADRLVSPE